MRFSGACTQNIADAATQIETMLAPYSVLVSQYGWNLCLTGLCVLLCRVTENKLREHFHLPLTEVAKKFGMCNTAFKKLCRKQGIMQWPYRTLRSLEKKMASLRAEQKFTNDNLQIEEQMAKLQAKREQILSGSGANISHDDDPVVQPSPSDDSSTRQVYSRTTICAPKHYQACKLVHICLCKTLGQE
jgi:hypothetical protein